MLSRLSSTSANPNQVQQYSQEPSSHDHQMSRTAGTNNRSNPQNDQSRFAVIVETDLDGNKSAKFGAMISGSDVVAALDKTGSLVTQGGRRAWGWFNKPKEPEPVSLEIPNMSKTTEAQIEAQIEAFMERKMEYVSKTIEEQVDARFTVMKKDALKTQRITTGAQLGGGSGMLVGVWQGFTSVGSIGLGAAGASIYGVGAWGYDRMANASSPETQKKLEYVDKVAQAIAPPVLAMGVLSVGATMRGESTTKLLEQGIKQTAFGVTLATTAHCLQSAQDGTSKEKIPLPLKA